MFSIYNKPTIIIKEHWGGVGVENVNAPPFAVTIRVNAIRFCAYIWQCTPIRKPGFAPVNGTGCCLKLHTIINIVIDAV